MTDRWHELLGWLDDWFRHERAEAHGFDAAHREVFAALAERWADADDKIALLEELRARYGADRVFGVLERVVADETRAYWASITPPGGTVDDLLRLLWEPLAALGFEYTVERRDDRVQIRCTRCPHADLAAELGAGEWLEALVCATDPYVVEAFDPPIRFSRTRTLMRGDGGCDHAYLVATVC